MDKLPSNPLHLNDTGVEVNDIRVDKGFAARQINRQNAELQVAGMRRLVRAVMNSEKSVLQELVDIAVELCGAESAGISVEQPKAPHHAYYRWVAANGACNPFLNADLPRYPSACGVSLERGGPQQFRFTQRFYDIIGISAPEVTDGIVLPWYSDGVRGTIFVMAHKSREAFDLSDCRMMELLSDFAALAIRQRIHQDAFLKRVALSAASAMANGHTDKVANPMQSLISMLYMSEGGSNKAVPFGDPRPGDELPPLSDMVNRMLSISYPESETN